MVSKTRTGFITNAKVLGELQEYQDIADVLEYRERAKIKSTYLDALPALIRGDTHSHPHSTRLLLQRADFFPAL